MELGQNVLQLRRDRQTQVRGVLQQGNTFIGQIEENHSGTKDAALAEYMDIQNIADTYQGEDQNLPADALEADFAGQGFVDGGAHDASDVVDHHEGDQRIQKAVKATQEPAAKAAQGRKGDLYATLDLFHVSYPPCVLL